MKSQPHLTHTGRWI